MKLFGGGGGKKILATEEKMSEGRVTQTRQLR